MVNEKRGAFWEQQVYAAGVAVMVAVAVGVALGKQYVGWAYIFGALYGMLSYECWLTFLNNFGSMIYEEGEEPGKMTVIWAGSAPLLPPLAVFVALVGMGCLAVSTAKYYYDRACGRIKTS